MMIRVSRLSSSSSSCGRRCVTEWRGMSGCRRRSMESVFVVGGRDGSSPSPASVALQRIRALTSILNPGPSGPTAITVRYSSSSSSQPGDEVITLGNVSLQLKQPENPELVPVKYKGENLPQSILHHLRWIMQKDLLAQDVFLVGPPGPLRRNIAMMYLEMTKKEVEYVSLSRDTTETDLKQRREIVSSSAVHVDQCAVRAAVKGRVLILEGIEKAERNVLPVLNNLLENREMQLDDGRFLMAASGYDKLLQSHSKEELDAWKLVRVHEDFRVIALGLPVPWYQGNPLDPPLRSRFQARNISALPYKDHLELLREVGEGVNPDHISRILSFAMTMVSKETHSLGLPDFPLDNLHAIIKILRAAPSTSLQNLLERLYPFHCMMANEGQTSVRNALKSFELLETEAKDSSGNAVMEIRRGSVTGSATVQLQCGHGVAEIQVPTGELNESVAQDDFIRTPYHDHLLSEMMQSHMVKDFCVIGSRGCGKSVLVRQFADLLGYHIETIMLYQDMTARDLLQQRMTTPSGDTVWRLSPLILAALEGSLAVLDGVHRVNAGTFAVLHRLIHDRELSLFDGSRLLRHDRYDAVRASKGYTEADMTARHVSFSHLSSQFLLLEAYGLRNLHCFPPVV